MAEDDFIYWQDVLELVQAQKTSNLKCPFCYTGTVLVTKKERATRLECASCHHYIEGRFRDEDVADG